jgi:hypothetical protein
VCNFPLPNCSSTVLRKCLKNSLSLCYRRLCNRIVDLEITFSDFRILGDRVLTIRFET